LEELFVVALGDNVASKTFAKTMPEKLEKDKDFITKISFSATAAFHVSR
jgi:hypothetical protein